MDCENENEMWDWSGEDYSLQKDTNLDISQSLWDGISQNEEDYYMFDGTTPVKDCGGLAYHVPGDVSTNKESQYSSETASQFKRRRMLQFDDEVMDKTLHCEEISSVFINSKETENSLEDAIFDIPEWVSGFSEDRSGYSYEGLDQIPDGWLTDCFNDIEMHCPENMNIPGTSNVQTDISEYSNPAPKHGPITAKETPTPTRPNVIFKGRKSYMRTPTKLASSVAYPFALIKPCGVHGDVTLKDINQRIRTPPPSKTKKVDEDVTVTYPTSAFSGKPVVGKTKIRIEGGQGSITIMRTKG